MFVSGFLFALWATACWREVYQRTTNYKFGVSGGVKPFVVPDSELAVRIIKLVPAASSICHKTFKYCTGISTYII